MAEYEKEQFRFPDEASDKDESHEELSARQKAENSISIEIEDDTPEQDRGKQPLPKELVDKLEEDELDKYSAEAKEKLKAMKKVWHDERREKEAADRERTEAIMAAKKLLEENKRLKATLSSGEKEYISTAQNAAELEAEIAKRAYKEALETGDSDRIAEAQEKMTNATLKVNYTKNYKPSLQEEENEVQIPEVRERRPVDTKLQDWTSKNQWYGAKKAMTAFALGIHEELADEYGKNFVGSDEYYARIDKTIRRAFPEYFDALEPQNKVEVEEESKPSQRSKPSTVVAPATRSTSSKQVRLKQSQVAIAKKLGLTPEQYARELLKMEA